MKEHVLKTDQTFKTTAYNITGAENFTQEKTSRAYALTGARQVAAYQRQNNQVYEALVKNIRKIAGWILGQCVALITQSMGAR